MLEKIVHILFWREEAVGGITTNVDAKEEVHSAKILQSELRADPGDNGP